MAQAPSVRPKPDDLALRPCRIPSKPTTPASMLDPAIKPPSPACHHCQVPSVPSPRGQLQVHSRSTTVVMRSSCFLASHALAGELLNLPTAFTYLFASCLMMFCLRSPPLLTIQSV